MKYLIAAVLLSIMQASPPVPRQAPDNPAQTATEVKGKNAPSQAESSPAPTPLKTDSNRPAKSDSGEQHSNNTDHAVGISKLPPVSVTRDWADWGVWVFSLLLVIVGFLQVWLLGSTLTAIRRQANDMTRQVDLAFGQLRAMHEQVAEMSAQTDVLNKSVGVAEKSADAAERNIELIISKERARLWLEQPQRPEFAVDQRLVLVYRLFYEGFTPAFGVETEINAIVSEFKDSPVNDFMPERIHDLPTVVSAKDIESCYNVGVFKMGPVFPQINVDGKALHNILSGKWVIHLWGFIKYRDFFGQPRETTFRYRWIMGDKETWERWEQYGSPEDNHQT